ncbi:hypothetical protein BXO88_10975 [Oribacterium sp. C9]|uniref:hypothetical protein n=1 Tax=Oribacterium sp. C9 TaxID=1943579 RepID=UPI00098FD440|nr:hypothetical protein [Oribacterium sp. C9]OON85771.1 hypothetical protein BXO88_10975 [Oribacterium sp. C9]
MITMKPKAQAFLIENNNRVIEVRIVSVSDGMSVVRPLHSNGGFRVRNNRLYETKEKAEEVLTKLSHRSVVHNEEKPISTTQELVFMHPHSLGW